jgi:hypothetical protein
MDDRFQRDEAGELLPMLNVNQQVFPRDSLPMNHEFTERPRGDVYSEEFDPITRRYNASDAPLKTEELTHPINKLALSGFSNVIIFFGDDGVNAHFGEGLMSSPDATPWVRMDTQLHSQHPAIKIRIMDPEGKEPAVTCHIFPGCMERDDEGYCDLDIRLNRDTSTGKAVDYPEVRDRKINNALMEIKMKLWAPETVARQTSDEFISESEVPARPSFTGISLAELNQICEECRSSDPQTITLRRQLIGLLATQTEISIFRAWPIGGEEAVEAFKSWLMCAFQACAFYGYEWFYSMQMQHALDSANVNFRILTQHRWLASSFKTTLDDQGTLLQLEPYKIAPFVSYSVAMSKTSVLLPTHEVGVFELCAAIDKNKQRQIAVLGRFFLNNAFKITAVLKKHPTIKGKYLASSYPTADGLVASTNNGCSLEPMTRVCVFLRVAGIDDETSYGLTGIVVEDIYDTGADVTLLIDMIAGPLELNFDERSPPGGLAKDQFLASLTLRYDPTPTRRWKAAMYETNKGQLARKSGLDVKHLVLQGPPTIIDTGSMASEVMSDPQYRVIVDQISRQRRLSPTQMNAANLACTTKTGLATIQGGPGTGKTYVLGAIGEMQVAIGKQIGRRRCGVAVAPSTFAIEQLAESVIGNNLQKMECVWYRGTHWANQQEQERIALEDNLEDLENVVSAMRPLWHLAEEMTTDTASSALSDIEFVKKRFTAIRRWASSMGTHEMGPGVLNAGPEHPMANTAQQYLDLRTEVQIADGVGQNTDFQRTSHDADVDRLRLLEEECTEYYLQNEVDMVFCTNTTSVQGLLRKYYQPNFVLQDNAAEINVPEAATTLAAFVESIELMVQAGDRTQQRARPASQGFNEHLGMLFKSPMELILVNDLFQGSCIEL